MTTERDTWKSTTGFILAAIGSAVGLGNIWRFSYVCYDNGGGTFLIPYVIAILVVGVPVMILEFAIGHKMRSSAPKSMSIIHKEWEWLGWWPVVFVMFGINLYYSVVIAWCLLFTIYSLQSPFPWEEPGTEAFFGDIFLNQADSFMPLGGVQWHILAATAAIWFVLWIIGAQRVQRGIERAARIFMPLLAVLVLVLVVWGLFLEGSAEGLRAYFLVGGAEEATLGERLQTLGDINVWRDAFSQVFFSLSIGFGIMIAYASYLPPKTDLVKSAFITAFADCLFAIVAGVAVFTVLGYMAHEQGTTVGEVVEGGPGLCFVTYPKAISLLPAFNGAFGFVFFLSLVIAGLTSAMSILEAFISAAMDKFGVSRIGVATATCIVGFLGSIVFATDAGVLWLDSTDHYLNNYGLITVGLLECLLIIWYYRIDKLHFHLSDVSEGGYPILWDVCWEWAVKFAAPLVLLLILIWGAAEDLSSPYGGEAAVVGVLWLAATFLVAGFFSVYTKRKESTLEL